MSLIKRKPRPLQRDEQTFRDDRLIIIACDDTYAPKQYFGMFRLPRVHVHVIPAELGLSHAVHVYKKLLNIDHEEDDELWMLLDTDHCVEGSHRPLFISTIIEAERSGIFVAISRPCFEVWLLLHHVQEAEIIGLKNASEVEEKLRELLTEYNKTKIDVSKFPIPTIRDAIARAENIDGTVPGGTIPEGNTTRVYKLVQSIIQKSAKRQISSDFF